MPGTSARSCETCTTAASIKAKASGSSRSPTGPSSTSGNTFTGSKSRWCRPLRQRARRDRVGRAAGPLGARPAARPGRGAAESHGCTYCTRGGRLHRHDGAGDHRLLRRFERENRVIDHDREGSMEIKKAEGHFLTMGGLLRLVTMGTTGTPPFSGGCCGTSGQCTTTSGTMCAAPAGMPRQTWRS